MHAHTHGQSVRVHACMDKGKAALLLSGVALEAVVAASTVACVRIMDHLWCAWPGLTFIAVGALLKIRTGAAPRPMNVAGQSVAHDHPATIDDERSEAKVHGAINRPAATRS
jgi:hypothetical protein